ncbi:hypothetical protein BH23GEM7_BH23GEM7_03640 [soil metagenome]
MRPGQLTAPGSLRAEEEHPPAVDAPAATVALLPWGLLYEDFLSTIGVSLDAFATEMTGGYLFNYVDALRLAGIRSIIVLVSARVDRPTRLPHLPTGATILVLPPPAPYRALRSVLRSRLAQRALARTPSLYWLLEEIAAYSATPLRHFVRELRREGCDALLCQEYEYTRFDTCVALGRWMRIPVFATFQGGDRPWGLLQGALRPRALARCAGLVIGPQLEIQRVWERYGVADEKIARIFNPLDPAAFEVTPRPEARRALDLPEEARVVVWYGRVERERKGLDVLLDAWEQVCSDRPELDLRLLLIGTGSDAEWMRQRVATLRGVRWRDEYVHDRRVLRLHLSAADVFAFPSRHEGFPVAPIEAMACGVPVVAADAPGVPDILEGGDAAGGIVVPRGDAERFAQALGELVDDPQRARQLGGRARQRAEASFSLPVVGEQLRTFLSRSGVALPERSIEVKGG